MCDFPLPEEPAIIDNLVLIPALCFKESVYHLHTRLGSTHLPSVDGTVPSVKLFSDDSFFLEEWQAHTATSTQHNVIIMNSCAWRINAYTVIILIQHTCMLRLILTSAQFSDKGRQSLH